MLRTLIIGKTEMGSNLSTVQDLDYGRLWYQVNGVLSSSVYVIFVTWHSYKTKAAFTQT